MPRKLNLLLFLIAMFSLTEGQIVIDSSDFNPGLLHEIYGVDSQRLSRPLYGNGVLWDYSGLKIEERDTLQYEAAMDTNFPSASRYRVEYQGIDTFLARTQLFETKNDSFFGEVGGLVNSAEFSLFLATGNMGDSIYIDEHSVPLSGRALSFPVSYLKNWSTTYRFEFPFRITVASLAHNKVPYSLVANINDGSLVRGTGVLRVPDGFGGVWNLNAVLVQRTIDTYDSLYQAGSPAPPIVLAAMGLKQNERRTAIEYRFYGKSTTHPLLYMVVDTATGLIRHSHFFLDAISSLGPIVSQPQRLKAFPVPSSAIVEIDLGDLKQEDQIRLMDLNGRLVKLLKPSSANARIDLSGIESGSYTILHTRNSRIIGFSKIIKH